MLFAARALRFNPSQVRLEQLMLTILLLHIDRFNPSQVRLEPSPNSHPSAGQVLQSFTGSSGTRTRRAQPRSHRRFNPSQVRLEQVTQWTEAEDLLSLQSFTGSSGTWA